MASLALPVKRSAGGLETIQEKVGSKRPKRSKKLEVDVQSKGIDTEIVKAANSIDQPDKTDSNKGNDSSSHSKKVFSPESFVSVIESTDYSSMAQLGKLHFHGTRGLARDSDRAFKLLDKAYSNGIESGDVTYLLGVCWQNGLGTPIDLVKACKLFKRATSKQNYAAAYELAQCHYLGIGGLSVDKNEALKFFKMSSKGKHKRAKEALKKLKFE